MIRMSEEQKAILNCYAGTKDEVVAELEKAIPFIDDLELKDNSQELFSYLMVMSQEMIAECRDSIYIDLNETEKIV